MLGLCGRALIERWRKEIERPPANAPGKGQAPSQATGSQQKPASQAAPGPARVAAVGSQRPPPEAKRAPLGEPAKPSTLAGKLPAMKAEQIVRSLKPVDPKRTAIHGADVRTDLSTLPGPNQTQQSGLSSQVSAVRKTLSSLFPHHAFPRARMPMHAYVWQTLWGLMHAVQCLPLGKKSLPIANSNTQSGLL